MLECDWKEFINETKKVGDFSLCKVRTLNLTCKVEKDEHDIP